MGLCRSLLHRMGFNHRASPCLAVVFGIVAFTAGAGDAQAQESRLDANGTHTGFEIEFARLLAKSILGSPDKIEFVTTTVDGRFPAVLSGRVDFGIATGHHLPRPRGAARLHAALHRFRRPSSSCRRAQSIKAIAEIDSPDITFGSTNSAAMVDRAKRYAAKAKPMFFDTIVPLFRP